MSETDKSVGSDSICEYASDASDSHSDSKERQVLRSPKMVHLEIDDHILEQFAGKKAVRFYIGRITQLDPDLDEVETTCLQRRLSVHDGKVFFFPVK